MEKDKLDPIKQQKQFQEKVINVKKGEIEGLNNDKTELEQLLIKKETERKLLVEELNQLESKMKESRVDLNFVQNYVLEFTIGYSAFINQNFTKIHSKEKTSKLYEMVNEFFENNNLPTIKTNVLGAE